MTDLVGADPSDPGGVRITSGNGVGLFGLLEERIASLLERFHQALKRIEDLEMELAERDARATSVERRADELRGRLEGEQRRREELRERTGRLIEELARLEARELERAGGVA